MTTFVFIVVLPDTFKVPRLEIVLLLELLMFPNEALPTIFKLFPAPLTLPRVVTNVPFKEAFAPRTTPPA